MLALRVSAQIQGGHWKSWEWEGIIGNQNCKVGCLYVTFFHRDDKEFILHFAIILTQLNAVVEALYNILHPLIIIGVPPGRYPTILQHMLPGMGYRLLVRHVRVSMWVACW